MPAIGRSAARRATVVARGRRTAALLVSPRRSTGACARARAPVSAVVAPVAPSRASFVAPARLSSSDTASNTTRDRPARQKARQTQQWQHRAHRRNQHAQRMQQQQHAVVALRLALHNRPVRVIVGGGRAGGGDDDALVRVASSLSASTSDEQFKRIVARRFAHRCRRSRLCSGLARRASAAGRRAARAHRRTGADVHEQRRQQQHRLH